MIKCIIYTLLTFFEAWNIYLKSVTQPLFLTPLSIEIVNVPFLSRQKGVFVLFYIGWTGKKKNENTTCTKQQRKKISEKFIMLANLCPWPLSYQENLSMRNSMCQSQSISRQNGFLENLWKQRWTLVIFLGMENILCPGFSFSWDCLHFLALGEFIYNLC